MSPPRLQLTREQILSYRQRVGALDRKLLPGTDSLHKAAWAGLQDSMPRAALLSIHARVKATPSSVLDDPSLVQVWGPRYSVFVVSAEDQPIFTIGRMPQDEKGLRRSEDVATRIANELGDAERSFADVAHAIGANPNGLRYATTTGTILLNWDGARRPTIRLAPRPDVDPIEMALELARRFLHVYGPSTAESFASWAGVRPTSATNTFEGLLPTLTPVTTPIGEAWILSEDEPSVSTAAQLSDTVRLLPSGDAYYLLQGRDRDLLIADDAHRDLLWTSRVWPGAILANGEIIGTWRRSKNRFTIEPWGRLGRATTEAVEAEAAALPLPEDPSKFALEWM
jgi:hypothetical protein